MNRQLHVCMVVWCSAEVTIVHNCLHCCSSALVFLSLSLSLTHTHTYTHTYIHTCIQINTYTHYTQHTPTYPHTHIPTYTHIHTPHTLFAQLLRRRQRLRCQPRPFPALVPRYHPRLHAQFVNHMGQHHPNTLFHFVQQRHRPPPSTTPHSTLT